jgi:hypothetical protein
LFCLEEISGSDCGGIYKKFTDGKDGIWYNKTVKLIQKKRA